VRTRDGNPELEGLKRSSLPLIRKSNDFCFDFICMKAIRVARHVMVHCKGHLMFKFAFSASLINGCFSVKKRCSLFFIYFCSLKTNKNGNVCFHFSFLICLVPKSKNNSPDLVDNNLVTPHMTSTNRAIRLKKKAKKIVICWDWPDC
jgi:hypothetical protein